MNEKEKSITQLKLPDTTRTLKSEELFQGKREVVIEHQSALYRLQITKAGKLILNK